MNVNKKINDLFRIILNILLITMAISSLIQAFNGERTISAICFHLLIVVLCVFSVLKKKYRYVGTSILLLLIIAAYLIL